MSKNIGALDVATGEEELGDYRLVLSCMRKRFEGDGMLEALERLEKLDAAIFQAILDRLPPRPARTINWREASGVLEPPVPSKAPRVSAKAGSGWWLERPNPESTSRRGPSAQKHSEPGR
jgi:hypothetical protein